MSRLPVNSKQKAIILFNNNYKFQSAPLKSTLHGFGKIINIEHIFSFFFLMVHTFMELFFFFVNVARLSGIYFWLCLYGSNVHGVLLQTLTIFHNGYYNRQASWSDSKGSLVSGPAFKEASYCKAILLYIAWRDMNVSLFLAFCYCYIKREWELMSGRVWIRKWRELDSNRHYTLWVNC